MSARGWFITGTDTGVGKTRIATALIARLRADGRRVAGLKPVAAGCRETPDGLRNEDAELLLAAAGTAPPYSTINPYAFAPPIAPHIAAAEAGVRMTMEPILAAYATLAADADDVVVEGAGGWLVPFDATRTLADVAVALRLDVILVVGIRLGCLNHALLTAASVATHGLRLAGWVANHLDPEAERVAEQIATLEARLDAPQLGTVPYAAAAGTAAVAACLDLAALR